MSIRPSAPKLSTKHLGLAIVSTAAVGAGVAAVPPAADAFYCTAYGGPGDPCHKSSQHWLANSGTSSGHQYVCVDASQSGFSVYGGNVGYGINCAPTGSDISFPLSSLPRNSHECGFGVNKVRRDPNRDSGNRGFGGKNFSYDC
jgi:hypothetical protein